MSRRLARRILLIATVAAAAGSQCTPAGVGTFNPFTDSPLLIADGQSRRVTNEISRLGLHSPGEVLKLTVNSNRVAFAQILRLDDERSDAGVIIDGGRTNETFLHRVAQDGELFLFLPLPAGGEATVTIEQVSEEFHRPGTQAIAIGFGENFLADGLFDPATNTEADRQFLATIQPIVEDGIRSRLREIFAGTPIIILDAGAARPDTSSVLHYLPDRVLGDGLDTFETSSGGECEEIVVFGELLPRGADADPGNRIANDEAAVYVGSFRGRGGCDPGLLLQSANNIINALAVTGAHEIGHMVGLGHTALDGLMAVAPSLAVQRDLRLERSQIVLDVGQGLQIYTTLIQDPQVYFNSVFGQ